MASISVVNTVTCYCYSIMIAIVNKHKRIPIMGNSHNGIPIMEIPVNKHRRIPAMERNVFPHVHMLKS